MISKKILVVEDNSDCRDLLAVLFKRAGYEANRTLGDPITMGCSMEL
jgi:hypothetical protein